MLVYVFIYVFIYLSIYFNTSLSSHVHFILGERKRQLTAAVLSDHHGAKKGKKAKDSADGEGDIGAIGRILQRALQKRTREKEGIATPNRSQGGVKVIESVMHVSVSAVNSEESRNRIVTTVSNSSLSSGRTSGSDTYSMDDLSQKSA